MKTTFLAIALSVLLALTMSACEILDPTEPGLLVPRTVDEDATLPSIAVNGTQLHAEAFGDPNNPMIVVLHGGPGGDYRALLNCTQFANDGYYVVFYDQRGSGLSMRHPREIYTVQLMIDDLDSVIAHYRRRSDQKIFLLGQSWGAMLATAYVNEHPQAISGLVLSEPGGFTWKDTKDYIARERDMKLTAESTSDFMFVDQLVTASDHVKLDYRAALQSAANFAPDNKVGNAGLYPFWRIGAVCNKAAQDYAEKYSFDFTTNLAQFRPTVLFVYSELNQAYGRTYAQHVSSAYKDVELVEIAGSGHEIPYFGWETFYPVAKAYFNTVK